MSINTTRDMWIKYLSVDKNNNNKNTYVCRTNINDDTHRMCALLLIWTIFAVL